MIFYNLVGVMMKLKIICLIASVFSINAKIANLNTKNTTVVFDLDKVLFSNSDAMDITQSYTTDTLTELINLLNQKNYKTCLVSDINLEKLYTINEYGQIFFSCFDTRYLPSKLKGILERSESLYYISLENFLRMQKLPTKNIIFISDNLENLAIESGQHGFIIVPFNNTKYLISILKIMLSI